MNEPTPWLMHKNVTLADGRSGLVVAEWFQPKHTIIVRLSASTCEHCGQFNATQVTVNAETVTAQAD